MLPPFMLACCAQTQAKFTIQIKTLVVEQQLAIINIQDKKLV
jgi:hypothetical protein